MLRGIQLVVEFEDKRKMLICLFGIITVFDVAVVGAVARTSNRGTLLLSVLI